MSVGVNVAVTLSVPCGNAVVVRPAVADVPLTVVATGEPRAVVPVKNCTDPGRPAVSESLSVTVAVSVSEPPKLIELLLSARAVEVPMRGAENVADCAVEVAELTSEAEAVPKPVSSVAAFGTNEAV